MHQPPAREPRPEAGGPVFRSFDRIGLRDLTPARSCRNTWLVTQPCFLPSSVQDAPALVSYVSYQHILASDRYQVHPQLSDSCGCLDVPRGPLETHRGKPIWVTGGGPELPVFNAAISTALMIREPVRVVHVRRPGSGSVLVSRVR
jgi:hypothetical protein